MVTPASLTPFQRKGIYLALFAVNAVLAALQQADMVPAIYAQAAALGAFLIAAAMKRFQSDAAPPQVKP